MVAIGNGDEAANTIAIGSSPTNGFAKPICSKSKGLRVGSGA